VLWTTKLVSVFPKQLQSGVYSITVLVLLVANISLNIFTKLGINHLSNVARNVVKPTQIAFMPRSHILEECNLTAIKNIHGRRRLG
jgi:hypothetical protein